MGPEQQTDEFENRLRTGLSTIAATQTSHGDWAQVLASSEAQTASPSTGATHRRNLRPIAVAAAVIVIAAAGAVALRDRGSEHISTSKPTGGETTTSVASGELRATQLSWSFGSRPPEGLANIDAATTPEVLADLWVEAGLPNKALPQIDFAQQVVLEIAVTDEGCPSETLSFSRHGDVVRAVPDEPATCEKETGHGWPRTFFYALDWAQTGSAFTVDVDPRPHEEGPTSKLAVSRETALPGSTITLLAPDTTTVEDGADVPLMVSNGDVSGVVLPAEEDVAKVTIGEYLRDHRFASSGAVPAELVDALRVMHAVPVRSGDGEQVAYWAGRVILISEYEAERQIAAERIDRFEAEE